MMDAVSRFRRAAAGRQFLLGQFDCGLLCADWVREAIGIDPAAEWRGSYSTVLGLARLLKSRGGLVAHFDSCLAACHIERCIFPRRGDVVVVEAEQGLTAGIVTGKLVMLPGTVGIVERRIDLMPIVAAWRI